MMLVMQYLGHKLCRGLRLQVEPTFAETMLMSFQSLDNDALYEIFKHFVAVDKDGPLTISLLCLAWQTLVLSSSSLWTNIFIDEDMPDLDARSETYSILSAGRLLHIYLKMPCRHLQKLKPLMPRCHTLDIDISWDKSGFKSDPGMNLITKEVDEGILRPYPSALQCINWYFDGKPVQFNAEGTMVMVGDRSSTQRTITFQGPSADVPLEMITSLGFLKNWVKRIVNGSARDLPFILPKFVNLRDLQLGESWISYIGSSEKDIVYLPALYSLTIYWDKRVSHINNAYTIRIRAPSLYEITIRDSISGNGVSSLSEQMFTHIKPLKLSLPTQHRGFGVRMPDRVCRLEFIKYLEVQFIPDSGQSYKMIELDKIIHALPNLGGFTLHLAFNNVRCLEWLSPLPCVFKLVLSQPEEISDSIRPKAPIDVDPPYDFKDNGGNLSLWPVPKHQVDDLTLCVGEGVMLYSYWCDSLARSRIITITRPVGRDL